jgi:hypothetical protein
VTEEPKDKPKEIPMPVPSYGAGKATPKNPATSQHKIDPNSDQSDSRTNPSQAGQKDTGGSPKSSPNPEPPVSPLVSDDGTSEDQKKTPALPFNEGDLMSKQTPQKTNVPATRKTSPPAVAGGPSDMDLDRQISDKKTKNWLTNQGAGYNVQGKFRPDAASIQGAANKNGVSSEILKAIQTKEYAEVTVRTYLGDQYVDTIVHHDFENNRKMLLLEMASKHPETVSGFSDEGMPVFNPDATFVDNSGKTKSLMYTVMHSLLADINFSLRDATTKAASAGQVKILNGDWRSDEEIESEARERELVETLIKSNK